MHLHKSTSQFTCNSCFAQKPYPVRVESSSRNKQQIRTDFWENGIKFLYILICGGYEGTKQKNMLTFLTTILRKLSGITLLDKGRSIWLT